MSRHTEIVIDTMSNGFLTKQFTRAEVIEMMDAHIEIVSDMLVDKIAERCPTLDLCAADKYWIYLHLGIATPQMVEHFCTHGAAND